MFRYKLNQYHYLINYICKIYVIRCEELFDEQDSLLNYNKSHKILKAQFGENPDTNLLPTKSNLVEKVENMLNELEW